MKKRLIILMLLFTALSFSQTKTINSKLKVKDTPKAENADNVLAIKADGTLVDTEIKIEDINIGNYRNSILKIEQTGIHTYFYPTLDTDTSRGDVLLNVLNNATPGDKIIVKQGVYNTKIPITDGITLHVESGVEIYSDTNGALIYNTGDNDYVMNITGKGSFIHKGTTGDRQVINVKDASILNIAGKECISKNSVCIRTAANAGGGSVITSDFEYYESSDGTFDNVDDTSVLNLFGNYALSKGNFVLENDGGFINCYIKKIESNSTNPIERASSGQINVYNTTVISPAGDPAAISFSSVKTDLNFFNCVLLSDVSQPIQGLYSGSVFINTDLSMEGDIKLNSRAIILSKESGSIQSISTNNGDIEIASDGNMLKVLAYLGLLVSNGIVVNNGVSVNSGNLAVNDGYIKIFKDDQNTDPKLKLIGDGFGSEWNIAAEDKEEGAAGSFYISQFGQGGDHPAFVIQQNENIGIGRYSNIFEKLTVDGNVLADFYKSENDQSTSTVSFSSSTSGGFLNYTLTNNKLILKGTFTGTTDNTSATIATLPLLYRPNITRTVPIYVNGSESPQKATINTDGTIVVNIENGTTYVLDVEFTHDISKV